ncbi:MAG TPA: hypothetical protein VGE02_01825 [Gemmatimonadales bacterium]
MRLWLGIATFLAGAVVWFTTGATFASGRRAYPPWVPRFGLAMGALGLSVLASTRPGFGWSVSSIGFSLVAIVLMVWVMVESTRRR